MYVCKNSYFKKKQNKLVFKYAYLSILVNLHYLKVYLQFYNKGILDNLI